jgi:hypothetical protein
VRAALVLLIVAGCASPQLPAPAALHGNPCARTGRPCVDMYVVAHEDDDLLFMNPDIARSIAVGNRVVIVHVTTGDLPTTSVANFADQPDPPDFTTYWVDRERGILNAYAAMARGSDAAFAKYQPAGVVPSGWTASMIDEAGFAMPAYELVATSGQPISAVFLRLSDFQLEQAWNDEPGAGGQAGGVTLPPGTVISDACMDATVCPLGTTLDRQQVARDQLVDVLAGLIERYAADSVSAQDGTTPTLGSSPTGMFWDSPGTPSDGYTEYWDHIFSAAFVLSAATSAQATMSTTLALRLYRGYTISQEPPNLDVAEAVAKAQIFARYSVFDAAIFNHGTAVDFEAPKFPSGDYDIVSDASWQQRELATRTLLGATPLHGRLAVAGNCVAVVAGAPALAACDDATSWQITATNQLVTSDGASCLAIGDDSTVALASCSPQTTATTLFLFANGQLRSANAQCVAASGTVLASVDCGHEPPAPHATGLVPASQDFTLLFDAPRDFTLVAGASALSILRGAACTGEPSELVCAQYTTAALGPSSELAALAADATDVAAAWDGAADGLVGCSRASGVVTCGARSTRDHADDHSLRYVDLAGTGAVDVCGRTQGGLACSRDLGDAWTAAESWTQSFSDAGGWAAPAYSDSVQFADVDGDGLADACGRSSTGVQCAAQVAGQLIDTNEWSFDEDRRSGNTDVDRDFSDNDPNQAWLTSEAFYSSFRLVDVNHDGLADACARGAAGIYCAFSTGTAFERKKLVAPGALVDAAALAWGDLEDDGRIDACGLVATGLECLAGY